MSEFQALIDALNNHTKALEKFVGAAGKAPTAAASTETTAAKTTGNKPAANKPKGVTKEQVAEAFGTYLKVKDKAELAERVANMKAINEHFGLAKITEGTPEQWKEALGFLKVYENGEDPFADGEGDGEDDGDGESLV